MEGLEIIGTCGGLEEFAKHVSTAKSYINTLLSNLYDLDATRKSALDDIHENFELIYTYLSSVDISFTNKAAIKSFKPINAFMLLGFGQFHKKEGYISKKTLDKLNPNKVKACEDGQQKGYGGFSIVHGPVNVCKSDQEAMIEAAFMEIGNPLYGIQRGECAALRCALKLLLNPTR